MDVGEMNRNITNNLLSEANKSKDLIHRSLVEELEVSKLPENVFRDYFLPRFASRVADPGNWLVEWISIAGTPTAPVDIVDNTGTTIFRVPAVLYTKNISNMQGGASFDDIFTRYIMHKNNLAQRGTAFITAEMKKKADSIYTDEGVSDIQKQWYSIYDRYGYLPGQANSANPGNPNTVGNPTDTSEVTDMFDYD